jgi:hypothetical protein
MLDKNKIYADYNEFNDKSKKHLNKLEEIEKQNIISKSSIVYKHEQKQAIKYTLKSLIASAALGYINSKFIHNIRDIIDAHPEYTPIWNYLKSKVRD